MHTESTPALYEPTCFATGVTKIRNACKNVHGKETNEVTEKRLAKHDTAQIDCADNKALGLGHVRRLCFELSIVGRCTVDLVNILAYDPSTHKLVHAPRNRVQCRNEPAQLQCHWREHVAKQKGVKKRTNRNTKKNGIGSRNVE